ncbi:MAG TPA: hypothetical protein VN872_07025, partial [Candidatus Acidoferrum sp.]|nr:hypothetical protein [Candidatus Acidoferrum sp.]
MSCAAYAKKVLIRRLLPIFIALMLSCACSFGQTDSNPKQAGPESKKTSKGKKQTGAASQEKKMGSQPAEADKTQAGAG